ncbi:hypothetical protein Tco_1567232 [Tanacetum coccineum]
MLSRFTLMLMLQTFSPKDLMSQDLIFWWLTLECSIYSRISSGEANQQVTLLLRASYGAELVSAARLVNTARSKMQLGLANLVLSGKFGAVRQIWCCQANFVLPGKFGAASSIHHALTISPTIYTSYIEQFWNTASSQTVNDVKQIDTTVDSKVLYNDII